MGAHLANNNSTASPGHGSLPHKTRLAEKGWGDGVGTDGSLQVQGSHNKSTTVSHWNGVANLVLNNSLSYEHFCGSAKSHISAGGISVKISSLWRADVVFCGQSWLGEPSLDVICPQSICFRTDTGMVEEQSGHWDKGWVSAGNYFETCQD